MYTYKSTAGLLSGVGSSWKDYQTGTTSMREMYLKFAKFYILAHDSVIDREIIINPVPYQPSIGSSDMTVVEWLDSMNGIPVAQVDQIPTKGLKFAEYRNAIQQKYKYFPEMVGYNLPPGYPLAGLKDLRVERELIPTDLTILHSHCLMSVDGFYHMTDADFDYTYVLNGNTTAQNVHCAHLGILSFLGIGPLEKKPLRKLDILPLTEGQPMKDGMILHFNGDVADKHVFLILGGYIVRPSEGTFFKNGDNSWVFYPQSIPYVARYFESRKKLDLSSMKVVWEDNGDPHMNVNQDSLWSDEVLTQYFMLSQTFWVAVDCEELFFDEIGIRVSNLPGFLAAYTEPVYPLIGGYGAQIEYSAVREASWWALRVESHYYKKFSFQVNQPSLVKTVSDHLLPYQQSTRTTAYMLRIGGRPKKKA